MTRFAPTFTTLTAAVMAANVAAAQSDQGIRPL